MHSRCYVSQVARQASLTSFLNLLRLPFPLRSESYAQEKTQDRSNNYYLTTESMPYTHPAPGRDRETQLGMSQVHMCLTGFPSFFLSVNQPSVSCYRKKGPPLQPVS